MWSSLVSLQKTPLKLLMGSNIKLSHQPVLRLYFFKRGGMVLGNGYWKCKVHMDEILKPYFWNWVAALDILNIIWKLIPQFSAGKLWKSIPMISQRFLVVQSQGCSRRQQEKGDSRNCMEHYPLLPTMLYIVDRFALWLSHTKSYL